MRGIAFALVCVLLATVGSVYGDGCRTFFSARTYYAPYIAPVYKQAIVVKAAPVYYELGQPAQVAAKQTYVMRTDPSYDRFLQFKAFEAGYEASQQHAAQQPQHGPNGYTGPTRATPLMVEHCANCHGVALERPKGGLVLDPSIALTGDQITEVMKRMRLPADHPEVMPPAPAVLQAEAKGGILEEVLQLHFKGPINGQLQPIPPVSPNGNGQQPGNGNPPLQPIPPDAASASR